MNPHDPNVALLGIAFAPPETKDTLTQLVRPELVEGLSA